MNTTPTGYRIRLRIRVGKAIATDDTALLFFFEGREVTITSQNKGEPLSASSWLALGARGFSSEVEAREYGENLRYIFEIAALATRMGVDVGQDLATQCISEHFARAQGLLGPNERIAPNIHGIAILPDDDRTRIPISEVSGVVRASADQLIGALSELSSTSPAYPRKQVPGLRMLNYAVMNPQPIAQAILAFSAVEALGQDEHWSVSQLSLIKQLADTATASVEGTEGERQEVEAAIRRHLHRLGLRQGVLRVLSRLGLEEQKKEWDRLYCLRSSLVHGTRSLSEQDVSQLAFDAVALCGTIVLRALEQEGATLPTIAARHFDVIQHQIG